MIPLVTRLAARPNPTSFAVGAPIRTGIGPLGGGGRLTIAPGEIVLTLDRVTRLVSPVSTVTHRDPDVVLLKARKDQGDDEHQAPPTSRGAEHYDDGGDPNGQQQPDHER